MTKEDPVDNTVTVDIGRYDTVVESFFLRDMLERFEKFPCRVIVKINGRIKA